MLVLRFKPGRNPMTNRCVQRVGRARAARLSLVFLGTCAVGLVAVPLASAGAAVSHDPGFASAHWTVTTCTKPPVTTTTEVTTTSAPAETTTSAPPETTTSLEVLGSTTVPATTTAPTTTAAPTTTVREQGSTVPASTTTAPAVATLPRTGTTTGPPVIFGLGALIAGAFLSLKRRPVRGNP